MGSAPTGQHGKNDAFEINEWEVFVMTEHAARNLAYQHLSCVPEKPTCLVELTAQDLIGLSLRSPLSFNEIIYCLLMLSVITDKGTGIVTNVTSDSPDDFMALQDVKSKAPFRAKFGVKICTDMKIKSQNEREKLDAAKKVIYKGGFYEVTMIAGQHAEIHVQDAKSLIRAYLLELQLAVVYGEPKKKVMSRSGDECMVALTDQWMVNYLSTGKFMTLKQDVKEFSADDTRFYLADVGDGMDDANFVVKIADAPILRLTKERTWMEEVFAAELSLRVGPPSTYTDQVFANEMNFAIKMIQIGASS
nr:leucine--tRNA ligase, cytoplasmic-like [Tanacetum cinerariifolium]